MSLPFENTRIKITPGTPKYVREFHHEMSLASIPEFAGHRIAAWDDPFEYTQVMYLINPAGEIVCTIYGLYGIENFLTELRKDDTLRTTLKTLTPRGPL